MAKFSSIRYVFLLEHKICPLSIPQWQNVQNIHKHTHTHAQLTSLRLQFD